MPTDQITSAPTGVDTEHTPTATPTIEVCRMCLDSAATLAARMHNLTRLDPALAKAAVMAEPDLCIGCCIDLGRQAWINTKRTTGDTEWTAQLLKAGIEKSRMVRP